MHCLYYTFCIIITVVNHRAWAQYPSIQYPNNKQYQNNQVNGYTGTDGSGFLQNPWLPFDQGPGPAVPVSGGFGGSSCRFGGRFSGDKPLGPLSYSASAYGPVMAPVDLGCCFIRYPDSELSGIQQFANVSDVVLEVCLHLCLAAVPTFGESKPCASVQYIPKRSQCILYRQSGKQSPAYFVMKYGFDYYEATNFPGCAETDPVINYFSTSTTKRAPTTATTPPPAPTAARPIGSFSPLPLSALAAAPLEAAPPVGASAPQSAPPVGTLSPSTVNSSAPLTAPSPTAPGTQTAPTGTQRVPVSSSSAVARESISYIEGSLIDTRCTRFGGRVEIVPNALPPPPRTVLLVEAAAGERGCLEECIRSVERFHYHCRSVSWVPAGIPQFANGNCFLSPGSLRTGGELYFTANATNRAYSVEATYFGLDSCLPEQRSEVIEETTEVNQPEVVQNLRPPPPKPLHERIAEIKRKVFGKSLPLDTQDTQSLDTQRQDTQPRDAQPQYSKQLPDQLQTKQNISANYYDNEDSQQPNPAYEVPATQDDVGTTPLSSPNYTQDNTDETESEYGPSRNDASIETVGYTEEDVDGVEVARKDSLPLEDTSSARVQKEFVSGLFKQGPQKEPGEIEPEEGSVLA